MSKITRTCTPDTDAYVNSVLGGCGGETFNELFKRAFSAASASELVPQRPLSTVQTVSY